MKSNIGQSLRLSRSRAIIAVALAIGTIIFDHLFIVYTPRYFHGFRTITYAIASFRTFLIIFTVLFLFCLVRWDSVSMGFVYRPHKGFYYWGKITSVLLGGLVILLASTLIVCWINDLYLPFNIPVLPLTIPETLVLYPIQEELLYRLVLCTPLLILIGDRFTIFVAGTIFGGLHFVYGVPNPANFFAGYFLSWAYIRSGTIIVPIVWHSLGNLILLFFYLSYSYLIN